MHLNLNAFKLCILYIARTPQLTEVDMSTAKKKIHLHFP